MRRPGSRLSLPTVGLSRTQRRSPNVARPPAGTSRKQSVLSVDGSGHRLRGALEAPVAQQHHPSGIRLRGLDLLEPGGGCAFRKELLALPDHNDTPTGRPWVGPQKVRKRVDDNRTRPTSTNDKTAGHRGFSLIGNDDQSRGPGSASTCSRGVCVGQRVPPVRWSAHSPLALTSSPQRAVIAGRELGDMVRQCLGHDPGGAARSWSNAWSSARCALWLPARSAISTRTVRRMRSRSCTGDSADRLGVVPAPPA